MAEEEKDEGVEVAPEAVSEAAPEAAPEAGPAPKKKKNKLVIVGVVVAVIVVLGVGLFVWHEQPSFCNAICHTPMDAYGATYLQGNVDKYGNDLSEQESVGMMAYDHKQKANTTCMGCHTPVLGQQVSEAMNWVTGNYVVKGDNKKGQAILEERTLDQLVQAQGLSSGDQFCLKSGCHVNSDGSVMTRDDLAEATASYGDFNPHKSHNGDMACYQCHKGHAQSVNFCTSCHVEAPVPDGWLSYTQYQTKSKID